MCVRTRERGEDADAVPRDISPVWKNGFAGGGFGRPRNAVYALVDDESPSRAPVGYRRAVVTHTRAHADTHAHTDASNHVFVTRCARLSHAFVTLDALRCSDIRTWWIRAKRSRARLVVVVVVVIFALVIIANRNDRALKGNTVNEVAVRRRPFVLALQQHGV